MVSDDMLSGLVSHYNGTVGEDYEPPSEPKRASRPQSSRRRGRPPARTSVQLNLAKDELIRRYQITEPTAHVLIQRFAMECRIPFEEAADIVRLGLMSLDYLRAHPDGDSEE